MEDFKQYLISEYKRTVGEYSAIDWRFTHNLTTKVDKKTNITLNNHSISINIKFYDKEMKLLYSTFIKFVNNELNNQNANKLVNISPAELNNKFMFAKPDIVKVIIDEYNNKQNEIYSKISNLKDYCECESIATSKEFKGELIQIKDTQNKILKKAFDM